MQVQSEYRELLDKLKEALPEEATSDLTFELIQHRFTKTAKTVIQQRYPKTKLELDETKRKYKWGRWGQGNYVYPDEQAMLFGNSLPNKYSKNSPGRISIILLKP